MNKVTFHFQPLKVAAAALIAAMSLALITLICSHTLRRLWGRTGHDYDEGKNFDGGETVVSQKEKIPYTKQTK